MSALPVPYQRQFNFSDWEANHPVDPPPGSALDAEFNAVLASIEATQARLTRIQDDDGALNAAGVLAAMAQQMDDIRDRLAALEARP
jgi:hypothetical protein